MGNLEQHWALRNCFHKLREESLSHDLQTPQKWSLWTWRSKNAEELKGAGVDALHFSAKKMVVGGMEYRNPRISMGGSSAVDEFALRIVDETEVAEILNLCK